MWRLACILSILGGIGIPVSPIFAADSTGLETSVAIDMVGRAGQANESKANRLDVREAELLVYAPVDPIFDGLLSLAAHQEAGVAVFEIHEARIGSTKLIPRSRFRLGQFFIAIGRLNQFHRHDWPFVSGPKVQRDFFHREGLLDTGLEYGILLPLPFFLDVTAGITNGWTFGHAHNEGNLPHVPTHYLRTATYFDLPGEGGTQIALNYLGRRASNGTQQSYYGLDATAKWREARTLTFLFQSEVWVRALTPADATTENTLGLYVFPQYGFDASFQAGLRGDYYSTLNLKDAVGNSLSNSTVALVPTLTYRSSEFTTFRAGYTQEWVSQKGTATQNNWLLELQTVFILGAHPAHEF
jgi:hypothetical protein